MKKKSYNSYLQSLYFFTLGILTSFSLPPYNFWIINFFTFSFIVILLFKNLEKNSLKTFFFYGYFFGFGYFLFSLYWVPFSLSHDENFKSLIPLATFIIPAFLSIFYAIAFFLLKFFSNSKSLVINILIFSLSLGLLEFFKGNILSGFPWNLFAYSLSENVNLIQINSIIGVYAFNTILITIFCAPSIVYFSRQKKNILSFSFLILVFLSFYVFGFLKVKNFNNQDDLILSTKIKILSTIIPIERFYSNMSNEEILKKLIELSDPKYDKKMMFIWPEGVIPGTNLKDLKKNYNSLFKKKFGDNHIIIMGINDFEEDKGIKKYYNSLSVIDNKTNILYKYYKNKLVPFGEFIPLENFLSKLGFKSLTNNYQSYTAGKKRKLFNYKDDVEIKVLPLICYEIIYSGNLSENNDYKFIVNISEDGWFGNSIGPYQHFVHTIFRSIEYGKYTLRSANNGISAIVDPVGQTIKKISINNEGSILLNKVKKFDKTIFSTYGNKIYFLIILLYIFLIFSFTKIENE